MFKEIFSTFWDGIVVDFEMWGFFLDNWECFAQVSSIMGRDSV